ncbi:MAG: DUF4180 domain-containing protein [Prevotellaceae bacterium]|jgi:hypothetical protein|nr:DUF4180 domain-containing protein [Prevotellaceae bacterium]
MEFRVLDKNIAMPTGNLTLNTVDDVLELIENICFQADCDRLIIEQKYLNPDFFDLKTGLLGEMLQKFIIYNIRIGIVGDFSSVNSKSFNDFIRESNKSKKIIFADTVDKATGMLNVQ